MSGETFKMWTTHKAMSHGRVEQVEVTRHDDRLYSIKGRYDRMWFTFGENLFRTREAATAAAREKVAKRIATLEKQMAKLRKWTFPEPPEAA